VVLSEYLPQVGEFKESRGLGEQFAGICPEVQGCAFWVAERAGKADIGGERD
jgi:hypothetical protein